jgi:hypothetical protein
MQQKAGLLRLIGSSNAAKTSLLAMSVLSDYIASKGLLRYDQLSPAAQVVAQDTTLVDQEAAYRRQLSAAREALATSSLHSRINDPHKLAQPVGALRVLRRWQKDRVYLVKCIEGNLTYFYTDGRLHRFIPPPAS